ncbi:MAG: PIN domain-containing protein, partial [Pseudomonadales bacterium]|nr:PIN domain-containing protein [Pseudomonadales bacterium]
LYAEDRASAEKRARAEALIAEHWRAGTLVISTQVLQEYFVAATRKLDVPVEVARRRVELLGALDVLPIRPEDILGAIDLHRLHGFSFWDALITTAAQISGCTVLFSEDLQHQRSIGGVRILNPFAQETPDTD